MSETPSDPLLDIIIVSSTGARPYLETLLPSLERHPLTLGASRVFLVDNASEDDTPEMVRARFPWVQLRLLDWNAGFCIANNLILRESGARYQLLLNPDTDLFDGVLDHMVRVMEERPDVGVSSCRLVQLDGTFDHAAKRSFPTPLGALAHFVGARSTNRVLGQYRAPGLGEHDCGEVDAINGAFALARKKAVDEVGLLDEGYWLYADDLDWCFRFKQKGWKVWYEGTVTAVHVKGGTTVRNRHRGLVRNVAFHRSMGRFYRKFNAGTNPLLDAAIYLAIGGKLMVSIARSAFARRSLK